MFQQRLRTHWYCRRSRWNLHHVNRALRPPPSQMLCLSLSTTLALIPRWEQEWLRTRWTNRPSLYRIYTSLELAVTPLRWKNVNYMTYRSVKQCLKGKKMKQMIYIAVLCNSRITAEPLYNTLLVHWTLCRCQQYSAFSMKALARYQVILLGEQRHIRCEQLAQGCCPNSATVGVEPTTSSSRVQCPTATLPSHLRRV